MWRFLLRWLAPLLVALTCLLPAARAQPPADPANQAPNNTERFPGFQGLVAVVSTLLVLLIVCKPSRKS